MFCMKFATSLLLRRIFIGPFGFEFGVQVVGLGQGFSILQCNYVQVVSLKRSCDQLNELRLINLSQYTKNLLITWI